jgi:ATP-binding cassette subfamily E protein 1
LVIDHDLMLLDYLAERMLLFMGEPGASARTVGPMDVREGMNLFLKDLGVTFRRDKDTNRPRANKPNSVKAGSREPATDIMPRQT